MTDNARNPTRNSGVHVEPELRATFNQLVPTGMLVFAHERDAALINALLLSDALLGAHAPYKPVDDLAVRAVATYRAQTARAAETHTRAATPPEFVLRVIFLGLMVAGGVGAVWSALMLVAMVLGGDLTPNPAAFWGTLAVVAMLATTVSTRWPGPLAVTQVPAGNPRDPASDTAPRTHSPREPLQGSPSWPGR